MYRNAIFTGALAVQPYEMRFTAFLIRLLQRVRFQGSRSSIPPRSAAVLRCSPYRPAGMSASCSLPSIGERSSSDEMAMSSWTLRCACWARVFHDPFEASAWTPEKTGLRLKALSPSSLDGSPGPWSAERSTSHPICPRNAEANVQPLAALDPPSRAHRTTQLVGALHRGSRGAGRA